MRQSVRNRPPGFPIDNNAMQRRVASSDTRQVNSAYEQQQHGNSGNGHQNRITLKAQSQTRQHQQMNMNRSLGGGGVSKQQSQLLHNAADLLQVGHEQEGGGVRQRQMQQRGVGAAGGHVQQSNKSQPRAKLTMAGEAYQSSLLTRYVKQPPMPTSQSIHSALSHERVNGWPLLAPVRQHLHQQQPVQVRNSAAATSGIPRPSINKYKNKTTRMPSQGAGQSRKQGFQMPINYQNEQEIMKRIFGGQSLIKRTSSDSRFQNQFQGLQTQQNQTGYSNQTYYDLDQRRKHSPNKAKKTPQSHSSKVALAKKALRQNPSPTKQLNQQMQKPPMIKNRSHHPQQNLISMASAQAYTGDDLVVSSPPRRGTGSSLQVLEYSEPRTSAEALRMQKKNLMMNSAARKNGGPYKRDVVSEDAQHDMAQDSAERAFFELQDAKVNFFQEKTDHDDKMEKRRQNQTFTNGFGVKSNNIGGGAGDPDKTVVSTWESSTLANGQSIQQVPPVASRSNGFFANGNNPNRTTQARFGDAPLIGDENNLKSDFGDLSREEMKERLFVAEKVMKTLFKRNRELEENQQDQEQTTLTQNSNTQECQKCKNEGDIDHQQSTDALKDKVSALEKQLASLQQSQKDKSTEPQSYKEFMSLRLEQSQSESKRHFENYVNVRDQLNQLMEKQLQLDSKSNMTPDHNSSRMITPKSIASIKGGKLRQDMGQRQHDANLQEQELVLKREADNYAKGLKQIEVSLIEKDNIVCKLEGRVKQLEAEVDRRKFVEAKVQTYVRSLIDQNEKCKTFIRGQTSEQAQTFMHQLETSQFDEHDGQSTEHDEDDQDEEGNDEDEVEEFD